MPDRRPDGRASRRLVAHLNDPDLPVTFTRAQARAAGLSDRQMDRRITSGVWIPLRRGVFSLQPPSLPESSQRPIAVGPASDSGPVLDVMAAMTTHAERDLAVSHTSAALLHGLARPLSGWGRPTATSPGGCTRVRQDVHILVAPLGMSDVDTGGPVPITSLARTVADCVRSLPAFDAIALADSAARRGLTLAELDEVLTRQAGWPGIVRARQIAELMSPRRESPLESWSAWAFEQWTVPRPVWQVEIFDRGHVFCGRVDGWWKEGLAGEADGRAKYALSAAERLGVNARGLSDVLERERDREKAIRRTHTEMVRWGADDVLIDRRSGELAGFIKSQLGVLTRRPARFRGIARPLPIALTAATT